MYLYIGTENTNVTYFICQLFLSVHLLKLESDTDFNFQSRWNFLHDTYHERKSILKVYVVLKTSHAFSIVSSIACNDHLT